MKTVEPKQTPKTRLELLDDYHLGIFALYVEELKKQQQQKEEGEVK